jgi:hypothetical protein
MFLQSPASKDRSVRFDVDRGRALALLFVGMVCGGTAQAQTPVTPPQAGHMRAVTAQRAVSPPVIDGLVNEPAWNSGAVADDFWVSQRDQPPSDPTRVVVLYDDRALYFAFTCLDGRPDLIRANQITRDTAPGFDDRVTVELDPFHNHRSVSRFTVTARGTQSDALAGGRAQTRGWKGEWTAAARRTPFGWTAEIAIPIGLLEFEAGSDTFGINFSRYQNRTREWSEWATSRRSVLVRRPATSPGCACCSRPHRVGLRSCSTGGRVEFRGWRRPRRRVEQRSRYPLSVEAGHYVSRLGEARLQQG